MANTVFQLIEKLQGFAGVNVDRGEFPPICDVDETATENDAVFVEEPRPEIREIGGVAGLAVGHADGVEFFSGERACGEGHGEFWLGSGGEAGEFEGLGIRGEDDFAGANWRAVGVQNEWFGEIDVADPAVIEYKDAPRRGCFRQGARRLLRLR